MIPLAFILPLVGAAASLALSRLVASRLIGIGAAAMLFLSATLMTIGRFSESLPLIVVDSVWLEWSDISLRVTLALDPQGWSMALIVYAGGALGLLGAALALSPDLRGFGGLVAALLLAPGIAAIGACSTTLPVQVFVPVVVGMAWFAVLRSSGALPGSDAPLVLALAGSFAALVLVATLLSNRIDSVATPPALIVAGILTSVWVLCGLPPAHGSLSAVYLAPAPLATLAPFGLPFIGVVLLLRLLPDYLALLEGFESAALAVVGVLAFVIAATRAVWTTSLRQMVAAQLSAQIALIVVCAGCGGAWFVSVAPTLAINALITTLALALGVAALERRSGSDDVTALSRHSESALHLSMAGMIMAVSSAVGIPGTWGFWSRLWLFDAVLESLPWAAGPLLVGSSVLALALVAPLVRFWRAPAPSASLQTTRLDEVLPLVVGLLPILMGVAPHAIWGFVQGTPVSGEVRFPALAGSIASVGAALVLIVAPFALRRVRERRASSAGESLTSVLTPDTIGIALYGLAWFAAPVLPETAQTRFTAIALRIRQMLAILGRRYYLAAVLFVLIVTIFVLATG